MFKVYIRKLIIAVVLCYTGCAVAELHNEGKDYTRLPSDIRDKQDVQQLLVSDPDKVQVLFFFSFGCHGCEMLHTPFNEWSGKQNKNKVKVYYFPVSFNAQWKMLAKLYYVADTLDKSGKLDDKIFNALHKKGQKLWQEDAMKKFFVQQGYTEEQFKKTYKAFSTYQKVKRADELSLAFSVTVTPEIVVNGPANSYKVELNKVENSIPKLLEVLSYVVDKEANLLGKKK